MADKFQTPTGVISYPNLFATQPKGGVKGAMEVYSASLVFDEDAQNSTSFKKLKAAVDEAMEAYAKEKKIKIGAMRSPFIKDDKGKYSAVCDDAVYISPWSKFQPAVVDEDKQPILAAGDMHAGMKARLSVSFFCWTNSGNHGCSFALEGVQVYTNIEMPRLDGRRSGAEMFDDDEDDAF
jgi:hypothetical protein